MQNATTAIPPPPHKRARYEGLARYRRILKLDALFSSGLCLSTEEIARRLTERGEHPGGGWCGYAGMGETMGV